MGAACFLSPVRRKLHFTHLYLVWHRIIRFCLAFIFLLYHLLENLTELIWDKNAFGCRKQNLYKNLLKSSCKCLFPCQHIFNSVAKTYSKYAHHIIVANLVQSNNWQLLSQLFPISKKNPKTQNLFIKENVQSDIHLFLFHRCLFK